MAQFRKKPVVVEAIQFDGTCEGVKKVEEFVGEPCACENRGKYAWSVGIRTLEGWVYASPMDWIIKGVKGEFYPCKPGIFEATYETVAMPDTGEATE